MGNPRTQNRFRMLPTIGCIWLVLSNRCFGFQALQKGVNSDSGSIFTVLAITVIAILAIFVLWKFPIIQANRAGGTTSHNRFDRENEARKTWAQIIAGVFVLAGLYSSLQTIDVQKKGQVTDRFTKAIDQLGASQPNGTASPAGEPTTKIEVRLGGIYALESIMQDDPEYQPTVVDVLSAYSRANAQSRFAQKPLDCEQLEKWETEWESVHRKPKVRPDIQAILDVIKRRNIRKDRPDQQIDFDGIALDGANLTDARILNETLFYDSVLTNVDFSGSYLADSDFNDAIIDGDTDFNHADLSEASFVHAKLCSVNFRNVYTIGTDFTGAALVNADFTDADMKDAILIDAHVEGANLEGADNLTQEQLNSAHGNRQTKLPKRLKVPDSW